MRVAFVSRYPPVHCGVGEYTRMLAGGLKNSSPDVEVTVYSTFEAGREPYVDRVLSVRVRPAYERGTSDYRGLLEALAEDDGADVVHVQHEYGIHGYTRGVVDALAEARRERLARVVLATMHTVYHPQSGRDAALEVQASLGRLDAVVVHSFLQEYELQMQGLPPSKLYRIPHGTLINEYLGHPREALLSRLEEEIGLPARELRGLVLAVPGFLRHDKGLDVLVEAIDMIGGDGGVTVVVAGEVWSRDAAEPLSGAGGIVHVDRYLSHDQILRLVAAADGVVLPYRDKPGAYAVSGVLHLSMGSLKPIIGTRVPRLVELYQHAPGLTVPPRDPEALARMIKWLRENYDLAASYMSDVYAYAARTQWPRVARRHLLLYRSLLGGERPRLGALAGLYD